MPSQISLITGDNDFLMNQKLVDMKVNFGDNVQVIEANEIQLDEIQQVLTAQSLFDSGADQLVIINSLSSNKATVDYLLENYQNLNKTIVVVDPKFDKRTGLYKKLKADNRVFEFKKLKPNQLTSWLLQTAKSEQIKLGPTEAKLLVGRLGDDQWILFNELKKLALYDDEISTESINLLTDKSKEESIFDLLKEVTDGNTSAAIEMTEDLISQGNDPVYINSMLIWQFYNLTIIHLNKNLNDYDIARQYKISPYVVQKTRPTINQVDKERLLAINELLAKTDIQLKSVNFNKKQQIKLVITEICNLLK